MLFWLIVVGVVAFSWGFVAGATHEQYRPISEFWHRHEK